MRRRRGTTTATSTGRRHVTYIAQMTRTVMRARRIVTHGSGVGIHVRRAEQHLERVVATLRRRYVQRVASVQLGSTTTRNPEGQKPTTTPNHASCISAAVTNIGLVHVDAIAAAQRCHTRSVVQETRGNQRTDVRGRVAPIHVHRGLLSSQASSSGVGNGDDGDAQTQETETGSTDTGAEAA
jgi:hypothetical protein